MKTGTSAIQSVLREHDNSVVIYPKVGLWADGSHHNLVLSYFGDHSRAEASREDAGEMLARIGEEARRSSRDVVISSEGLIMRDFRAFAGAVLASIGDTDFGVEILFVAREHFGWTASLYNQRVKDPFVAETREPDAFLQNRLRFLPYTDLVWRAGKSGFGISAVDYHPASELVSRFLAHLGFAPDAAPAAPIRNVSLSAKALVATLATNRFVSQPEEKGRIVAALKIMPGYYGSSGFIFGPDIARAAEETFAKDRAFLRKRFGIDLPQPPLSAADGLFIDKNEYEEIISVLAPLGQEAKAVVEGVSKYLR